MPNESNLVAVTALEDEIASLTDDSTREERLAVAMSLVTFGSSINLASQVTGIPAKSLWDRIHSGTKSNEERQKYIEHRALEITINGLEKLETLLNDGESMRPSETIKAVATVAQIAAQLGKWSAPPPPAPEPEKRNLLREFVEALRTEAQQIKKEEVGE